MSNRSGARIVLGMNWFQKPLKRLLVALFVAMLGWGMASCSATETDGPAVSRPSRGALSEVSPPYTIQVLKQSLDLNQPQVKILSPRPNQVINDTQVAVKLQVKDLPLFKDEELGLGPYLQILLDSQPYRQVHSSEPLLLENLTPGTHTIRVLAVRPWHESFKNDGAFAQTTFHVFTPTAENNPDPSQPLLTYNYPQGVYGAEPVLLDFYLTNAPLHLVAREDPKDAIPDWKIRCTINGESFTFDRWEPIYLKGLKPGKNWVQLELLDDQDQLLPNVFNSAVQLVTYEPGGADTLARLTRGELTADGARKIVDPNYVPPVVPPAMPPAPEPAPAPESEEEAVEPEVGKPSAVEPEEPKELEPQGIVPKVLQPKTVEPEPTAEPNLPELIAPKVIAPELIAPKPVVPKPVVPKPVAPEPVAPKPIKSVIEPQTESQAEPQAEPQPEPKLTAPVLTKPELKVAPAQAPPKSSLPESKPDRLPIERAGEAPFFQVKPVEPIAPPIAPPIERPVAAPPPFNQRLNPVEQPAETPAFKPLPPLESPQPVKMPDLERPAPPKLVPVAPPKLYVPPELNKLPEVSGEFEPQKLDQKFNPTGAPQGVESPEFKAIEDRLNQLLQPAPAGDASDSLLEPNPNFSGQPGLEPLVPAAPTVKQPANQSDLFGLLDRVKGFFEGLKRPAQDKPLLSPLLKQVPETGEASEGLAPDLGEPTIIDTLIDALPEPLRQSVLEDLEQPTGGQL